MSYDLGCFYSSKPLTKAEVVECYVEFGNEGENSDLLEASSLIASFLQDLTKQFPRPEDEDVVEGYYDCPWATSLDETDRFVIVPIAYQRADELRGVIADLAKKHGLICFNPQTNSVLTAPEGILLDSSSSVAGRKKSVPKGPVAEFSKVLNELLLPEGYEKSGRVWRKSSDRVVIAIRVVNDERVYDVEMCAWFNGRGSVIPDEVDPFDKYHVVWELSDFPDIVLGERLNRARNFTWDSAEDPPVLEYRDLPEEVIARTVQAMEIDTPLTSEWRTAVLREIFVKYGLPFLKKVENGEITE